MIAELEPHLSAGQCVVDTSTSSVALTREIGARLAARGIGFADAPVARTREAAARGELSIMVGATDAVVRPCPPDPGDDGHRRDPLRPGRLRPGGQDPQQHAGVPDTPPRWPRRSRIGRRNGVPPEMLLPTIAKGSGDSFVLRSHGMKSMLPRDFPERAFSTRYAIKDLSYALEMAAEAGPARCRARELTMQRLKAAEAAGNGEKYHPVVLNVIDSVMTRHWPSTTARIMTRFPSDTAWRCGLPGRPGAAQAWAGPWSVAFADRERHQRRPRFTFADGRPATGRRTPPFTLSAPAAIWAKFLTPIPPRHHHAHLRACWPACRSSPSTATNSPSCSTPTSSRRVLEIGKWLALGQAAPVPAVPAPAADRAAPAPSGHRPLRPGDRRAAPPIRSIPKTAGTGRDLLCLHTAGADGRQFHRLMADPRITAAHRLVAFDLPWHGKSPPPAGRRIAGSWRLNTDLYVELIMGFIDAAGLRPPDRARRLDVRRDLPGTGLPPSRRLHRHRRLRGLRTDRAPPDAVLRASAGQRRPVSCRNGSAA